ncbi:MAG: hypothetical protein AAGF04_01310 [Chlamydiota bacterium]
MLCRLFFSLLFLSPLCAQDPNLGTGAEQSLQSGYVQNWAFAGAALGLAVLGIILVSVDQGASPSSIDS